MAAFVSNLLLLVAVVVLAAFWIEGAITTGFATVALAAALAASLALRALLRSTRAFGGMLVPLAVLGVVVLGLRQVDPVVADRPTRLVLQIVVMGFGLWLVLRGGRRRPRGER